MPSFSQNITDNRIIIVVAVSEGAGRPVTNFRALLDTGATLTAVSPAVVNAVGLLPTGTMPLTVASGTTFEALQYSARIDIPIEYAVAHKPDEPQQFLVGNQLVVAGLPYQPDGYDVILGMDLIGTFHMTIYRNRIILSN